MVGAARDRWPDPVEDVLGADGAAKIDRFDRVQLAEVLRVCRQARSLSEAGRRLFAVSRTRNAPPTTPTACGSTSPASAWTGNW